MKIKVLLIGGNGLIGSYLYVNLLKNNFNITKCSRIDKFSSFKENFDIVIHAANSSKKYEATKYPKIDYKESVKKTSKIINYFSKSKIILISSISSRLENNTYALNRKICENIVLKANSHNLVFRLPVICSEKNKRGILFDIIKSKNIYLDKNSKINPIFIDQFSDFFLSKFVNTRGIIEFGSSQDITIKEIIEHIKSSSNCTGKVLNLTSIKNEVDLPNINEFLTKLTNLISKNKEIN